MTIPMDHTGTTVGGYLVLERLPGLRNMVEWYRVKWLCCGHVTDRSQRTITKNRTQPPRECPHCCRNLIKGGNNEGIHHPQWGLVFPLSGPFGHRHGAGNTHAAERQSSD